MAPEAPPLLAIVYALPQRETRVLDNACRKINVTALLMGIVRAGAEPAKVRGARSAARKEFDNDDCFEQARAERLKSKRCTTAALAQRQLKFSVYDNDRATAPLEIGRF